MKKSIFWEAFRFVILDLIGDIIYFPIWWYTIGLRDNLKSFFKSIKDKEKEQALLVWIKNFFRPMYGQHDLGGKVISLVFRFLLLFWKLFHILIWVVLRGSVVVVWFILPPIAVFHVYLNLFF